MLSMNINGKTIALDEQVKDSTSYVSLEEFLKNQEEVEKETKES